MVSTALLRALRNMLPDALIVLVHERPWHSLTFAGFHICVSVTLFGNDHATVARELARTLPAHEFELCGQLVADIAVIETTGNDHQTRLLIDAIILED